MNFSPLTVFMLCLIVGGLGGVWSATKPGEPLTFRSLVNEILGSCCVGFGSGLLLYERIGQSEFGQCTLLGIALVLGMLGRTGLEILRDAIVETVLKVGGRGRYTAMPPAVTPPPPVNPAPPKATDHPPSKPKTEVW